MMKQGKHEEAITRLGLILHSYGSLTPDSAELTEKAFHELLLLLTTYITQFLGAGKLARAEGFLRHALELVRRNTTADFEPGVVLQVYDSLSRFHELKGQLQSWLDVLKKLIKQKIAIYG